MPDARKEHKAVVLMTIEIHEVLPTGECCGFPVPPEELKEYGLNPKAVLTLTGQTKEECLKKLKKVLNDFE